MSHRGTPGLMKRLNRSAILGLLREEGPLSRSDLARRLGLSPSTVTRIVVRLIEEGLVFETETVNSATGRKPTLLEFNYKAGVVIGVDVGGTTVVSVVADLRGDILFRKDIPVCSGDDRSDNLESVLSLIEELRHIQGIPPEKIRGIGVAVPSIVKEPEGIVVWAPALGWRDLHLKALLEDRFGLPSFVENDVNLAALGESRFGCAQGVTNLVAIFIGTGIGGGLILNGDLYRGRYGAAGELGYLLPTPNDLGQTYEQFGCLETLAAGPGIAQRAKAALAAGETSVLTDIDLLTAREVFEAARDADSLAIRVIEETVDYLAQAIANVTAVLNPEMVVLGGGVARSGDLLLEPIKERVRGRIPVMPEIVLSELGDEAVVQGAVALAVSATRSDVVVRDAKLSVAAG
ncbi:MAG: ROK family protein [Anaerolineae bacterium]